MDERNEIIRLRTALHKCRKMVNKTKDVKFSLVKKEKSMIFTGSMRIVEKWLKKLKNSYPDRVIAEPVFMEYKGKKLELSGNFSLFENAVERSVGVMMILKENNDNHLVVFGKEGDKVLIFDSNGKASSTSYIKDLKKLGYDVDLVEIDMQLNFEVGGVGYCSVFSLYFLQYTLINPEFSIQYLVEMMSMIPDLERRMVLYSRYLLKK